MKLRMLTIFLALLSEVSVGQTMKASFGYLPKSIDTASVNTAQDFRFLVEITSRLTDANGADVSGDIARKWTISEDKTTYTFTIENGKRFSDGSIITVDDVVESIKRTMNAGFSIHSDVKNIKNIEKIDDKSLRIVLKSPDPFFIQDMSYPEFAVLSKEDQKAPPGMQKFAVTSGPFYIKSTDKDKIILERNPYHSGLGPKNFSQIEFTEFTVGDRDKAVQQILDYKYDYFWAPSISRDQHLHLLEAGYQDFPTRNSYTFWITFNLKSKLFGKLENRQAIQKLFYENPVDIADRYPKIQNTIQLYHPLGPGRLSSEEAKKIYESMHPRPIKAKEPIRIVTFKGGFYNSRICDVFSQANLTCKLLEIEEFDEYKAILAKPNSFDAIIMNNDFSSDFLRKSLQITLYNERPLILVDENDQELKGAFEKSKISTDLTEITQLQRFIGERIIKKSYAMPLFYNTRVVYLKKTLDSTAWSTIESDFSVWKIRK